MLGMRTTMAGMVVVVIVKENESDLIDFYLYMFIKFKYLKKMWTSIPNLNCHAVQVNILFIFNSTVAWICSESWVSPFCKRKGMFYAFSPSMKSWKTRFHEWHIDHDNLRIVIYFVCLLIVCFIVSKDTRVGIFSLI